MLKCSINDCSWASSLSSHDVSTFYAHKRWHLSYLIFNKSTLYFWVNSGDESLSTVTKPLLVLNDLTSAIGITVPHACDPFEQNPMTILLLCWSSCLLSYDVDVIAWAFCTWSKWSETANTQQRMRIKTLMFFINDIV